MSIPRGRGLEKLAPHMAGLSLGEHREGRSRGSAMTDDAQGRFMDPTRVNFREPGSEKQGSSGEIIPLIANYVRVLSTPQWLLYQYHVTFSPDNIESKMVRRGLLGLPSLDFSLSSIIEFVLYSYLRATQRRSTRCCFRWTNFVFVQ